LAVKPPQRLSTENKMQKFWRSESKTNNWGIAYFKGEEIFEYYHLLLAHNGSGVFGAKRFFLASTNCVKVFRSKFKSTSFQGLHWLKKIGSRKVSFGEKLV